MHDRTMTRWLPSLYVLALGALMTACGGGGSGAIDDLPSGQGLVLTNFLQAGQDTVFANEVLDFRFSEAVDPGSVSSTSIQIREGPTFGRSVAGTYRTIGERVLFRPRLPTVCSLEDAGLRPGRRYRVTMTGFPEEFSVRNRQGQPLNDTVVLEFQVRPEDDPNLFEDPVPGERPAIVGTTPAVGAAAVQGTALGEIVVRFSENLDPCSLTLGGSIRLAAWERGNPSTFVPAPGGGLSGFDPVTDGFPGDPYAWAGGAARLDPPVVIPAALVLEQDFDQTVLRIRPEAGRLPENALVVVDLFDEIRDLGGNALSATAIAFTTANVDGNEASLAIEYDASTPIVDGDTTADVDTERSPGRAQAWLGFSGDGDNGPDIARPSYPILTPDGDFASCAPRPNDGVPDDLVVSGDLVLDTGRTPIPPGCANPSDGSGAVVWEFQSLHVRSTGRIFLTGVNPAIFLVRGDVRIDAGGEILLRGEDGVDSQNWNAGNSAARAGGRGVAGGGDGGGSISAAQAIAGTIASADGTAGYGSPDFLVPGGLGAGEGGATSATSSAPCNLLKGAQGGGGGAHATAGGDATQTAPTGSTWLLAPAGRGGLLYANDDALFQPSAGSGGGGGGSEASSPGADESSGGGGGAGGGFLSITAGGTMRIAGTIDASGGRGGQGGWDPDGSCNGANAGGGGGGAGGAIRLLCAREMDIAGATLLAAGGAPGLPGGSRGVAPASGPFAGAGAPGRIVLEDADSVIAGQGSATIVPNEGSDGFYRNRFDSSRFASGGTESSVVTAPLALGAVLDPGSLLFERLEASDFEAGVPAVSAVGFGETAIVVEMRGFDARADGTLDASTATGWFVVGHFVDSGNPLEPAWRADQAPADFDVDPAGGIGIAGLDGRVWVQVRTTLRLDVGVDADDPGPFVDRMQIRYRFDN